MLRCDPRTATGKAARHSWESGSAARDAAELWNGTGWRFNRMLLNLLLEFAAAAERAGELQFAESLRIESTCGTVGRSRTTGKLSLIAADDCAESVAGEPYGHH